jgi:hypothetical protein
MSTRPSKTQLAALKAMADGGLIKTVAGWHRKDDGGVNHFASSTIESCSCAGWCSVGGPRRHTKATITKKGKEQLRKAGIGPAAATAETAGATAS